jgi:hypothetical protein
MDRIDREQLYNTAWKHWGADAQADQLIEEMSELIHALIAARRHGTFYTYAVSEEMADVLICLEQFEVRMKAFPTTAKKGDDVVIVGCIYDQVEQIREGKLLRLKERLMESMTKKFEES